MRERTGVRPQGLDGGSLVQDGKKPETISDLFKPSPLPCLPANPREKLPAITLSRPSEDFSIVRPRTNSPLKLTAQQESCRDMTQSESPRRLEAPIVTYRWPHPSLINPKRGPRALPESGMRIRHSLLSLGPPSPALPQRNLLRFRVRGGMSKESETCSIRYSTYREVWARPHHHEGHLGPAFKHRR